CMIQAELGAVNAAAFDVSAACSGFVYALDIADSFLRAGKFRVALILGAETLSRLMDYTDRSTCILFGDGAASAVLTHSEKPLYSYLNAKGDPFQSLYCHINGKPNCPFHEKGSYYDFMDNEKKENYLQMDGKAVYKFAVDAMATAMNKVLQKAGLTADDVDLVIPHQANVRIIQTAMKQMKLPEEKVYINIYDRANTSSVCIPTCLDELKKSGRLHEGMRICLVGFGAGLTSGAVLYEI
ncbi:MAG: beta-ketoacyl-ACP synthase 3, partial [Ruminiclostridium sp.]|nr:beta-ketoacyl-ACP synthase 3 [Ruminiclostridium sp.]